MKFPRSKINTIDAYFDGYLELHAQAAAAIDRTKLVQAVDLLLVAILQKKTIYSCGNGGSAAISNHLVCDHVKGVQTDTDLHPRAHSLSSNIELVTAIGNDIGYADIFVYQLSSYARPGDVLISISSSGDSPNIVKAVEWAKQNGVGTISLTGFDGGRSAKLADVNLHVPAHNYGVVEDLHQGLMHVLAQFIRQAHMPLELIDQRKF